eukprot:scaffold159456_cov28-Tisochrysis_lutea.AAC.1
MKGSESIASLSRSPTDRWARASEARPERCASATDDRDIGWSASIMSMRLRRFGMSVPPLECLRDARFREITCRLLRTCFHSDGVSAHLVEFSVISVSSSCVDWMVQRSRAVSGRVEWSTSRSDSQSESEHPSWSSSWSREAPTIAAISRVVGPTSPLLPSFLA